MAERLTIAKHWISILVGNALFFGICSFGYTEPFEDYEQRSALRAIATLQQTIQDRLNAEGFQNPDDERALADTLLALDADRRRVLSGDIATVVNGVETSKFPATGALLSGIQTICSGTLIGRRSFLTAKHCFHNSDEPEIYSVYFQHAGIYRLTSTAFPTLSPDSDLAIVELDRDVTGIRPLALNELEELPLSASATIVGFGVTTATAKDSGLKRYGGVKTNACPVGLLNVICWNFSAPTIKQSEGSSSCKIDSGGPLLISPNNEVLAGVISGGSDLEKCSEEENTWNTEVFSFLDWINNNVSETQASTTMALCCDTGVRSEIFEGTIEGTGVNTEFLKTFEVPSDIRIVRVAMNATEWRPVNFDLSVRQGVGNPHTNHPDDCRNIGQYGFCEFHFSEAPPSNWSFRVNREGTSGSGKIQVVVTMFENSDG